jgi:membrane protein YdbS with pleckstrin-like domain
MNTVEFNNNEINIENLPQFQNSHFKKIAKEKLKVMYLSLMIFYSIVSIVILAINLIFDEIKLDNILIFSILSFLMILHFFYTFHAFHGIFYALREKDIIYKRGVFTKSITIIPFNRVQNIAIHQGIFSRWFKLANLELFTAGGNDMEIKGLYYEDALKIKEFITNIIIEEKELMEEDLKEKEINLEENNNFLSL